MKFLKFNWYNNDRFIYQWGIQDKNGDAHLIARPNYHDPYWDRYEDSRYLHLYPVKPVTLGNLDYKGPVCGINLKTFSYEINSEDTFYKRLG